MTDNLAEGKKKKKNKISLDGTGEVGGQPATGRRCVAEGSLWPGAGCGTWASRLRQDRNTDQVWTGAIWDHGTKHS